MRVQKSLKVFLLFNEYFYFFVSNCKMFSVGYAFWEGNVKKVGGGA